MAVINWEQIWREFNMWYDEGKATSRYKAKTWKEQREKIQELVEKSGRG